MHTPSSFSIQRRVCGRRRPDAPWEVRTVDLDRAVASYWAIRTGRSTTPLPPRRSNQPIVGTSRAAIFAPESLAPKSVPHRRRTTAPTVTATARVERVRTSFTAVAGGLREREPTRQLAGRAFLTSAMAGSMPLTYGS